VIAFTLSTRRRAGQYPTGGERIPAAARYRRARACDSASLSARRPERQPDVTACIAAECNDEVAQMVRDHPTRFMGRGTSPMQAPDRAIAEAERGMRQLGLQGFMIDDHVNNLTYDHPLFDPFWEAAHALGAFILIHQYQPTTVTFRTEQFFFTNSIGNLVDRTITFGCLVYGGVMDRYPGLRICLGHAGGYVSYAVDRMDKGLDRVGADRVLFGTDWPAPMVVVDPVRRIEQSPLLQADERAAILYANTARLPGA
jgi:aminocarboxymuconate-semialdehyde decarboxylase